MRTVSPIVLSSTQSAARCRITGKRIPPRKLVVSKMEEVSSNPILATCRPGLNFTFKGTVNGAIIGRISGAHGDMVRIYNPTTSKWEAFPIKDFESGFFKLTAAIGMNGYAILQDVFHTSSGTDFCSDWTKEQANITLRIIRA